MKKIQPVFSTALSRRAFVVCAGAASIGVAFGRAALAKELIPGESELRLNGWIRVGTDNVVTVYSPAAEMGQGVMTAMPLLIAEEMDLDWSLVRIEQAGFDPKAFGNPLFGGGMTTGASRTTRGSIPMCSRTTWRAHWSSSAWRARAPPCSATCSIRIRTVARC